MSFTIHGNIKLRLLHDHITVLRNKGYRTLYIFNKFKSETLTKQDNMSR